MLSIASNKTAQQILNQISNRYGVPSFPKNALRKGEKYLHSEKGLENQNFMLIKQISVIDSIRVVP